MQNLWRRLKKDLELVNGLSLDQVLRKSGIFPRIVHKELGIMLRKRCYYYSQKVDIPFSAQRHHYPEESWKVKEKGRCPYTSLLIKIQLIQFIALIFLSISSVSTGQWQQYAMDMKATGEPVILVGQSIVPGEIKAEVPAHDEEPRDAQIILQQYFQQVKSLSPENRLSKFCKEARFMSVVEVGQYFVTRDAGEFKQTVACREYTLPRDDQASQPKGWIRGKTRIGPILEVTTSFQHFKYGVEVRIQSVNEDNSHSWVRISYGTVRYVNNYIKYDTQSLADPQEEEYVPTSSGVVVARSKAKAKPQPGESTGTTTIPLSERVWIDIEPSKPDLESYNLSKKVINLLRHNQKLHREQDDAVQFYKIKFHLRDYPVSIQNWSDDRWLACLAAGGGSKRRYQYCSDFLGSIIYLRALQGHSGDSLIDLALQDNVLIARGVFPYIYHVGSNFSLSSILSNGLIPGGENLSRRQSVFFLPVDPRNEDHRDPEYIDYSVRRHARYVQNTWNQRRIEVLSDKIERNHPSRNTSSPLHCKSWKIEKWRKIVRKAICLLVHHRRSLWGTISIGIKGMINRVLQLNNSQLESSFNSHLEKQFNLVLPSQPNPLNPLKIVRGNPYLKRLLVCCKKN